MSKILITGHSGLLGSHLVRLLIEQGHDVHGVSRTNRMGMKTQYHRIDLLDEREVDWVMGWVKPDVVYHLAACAAEAKGQISPIDMTKRNMLISNHVLTASINHGVKKFIYASSVSVYGDTPTPYSEEDHPLPKDVYGVNKYAFEQELKIMAKVYGLDYTIFRPHNLYGPGQNQNDLTKNVINLFMRRLMEGKPYAILGDGSVKRGFSYVEDVAEIFSFALYNLSGVTMNVGSKNVYTIQTLSDLLIKTTGIEVPIERKPLREQEIDLFVADHKIQDRLVSYNETPLEEGLKKTWEWMKNQELGELLTIPEEIHAK